MLAGYEELGDGFEPIRLKQEIFWVNKFYNNKMYLSLL